MFATASHWLVQTRISLRDRLKHRPLLIFLIIHLTALILLCLLTLTLRELNATTSHLLRHIVDQANLTDVVFRNPEGKVGDWKDAPAVVLQFRQGEEEDWDMGNGSRDGGKWRLCDDTGTRCWDMGGERQVVENAGEAREAVTSTSAMTLATSSMSSATRQVSLVGAVSTSTANTRTMSSTSAAAQSSGLARELFDDDGEDVSTLEGEDDEEDADSDDSDSESDSDEEDGIDSDSDSDDEEEEDDEEDAPIRTISTANPSQIARSFPRVLARRTISLSTSQERVGNNQTTTIVTVSGVGADDLLIDQECAASFGWAINSLDNLIREEITLAAFYIWILILACIGLAKTSIPHLIAVTLSLTLSSLWIGVEIHLTRSFWASFLRTTSTRCAGANVIPSYWAWRMGFQVSTLLLNLVLLGASGWLSWRLRDHFGWETFQRIGASRAMKRMYSLNLAMSIILQLDAFVLITFFALWLAQITNGVTNYYMYQCRVWQAITSLLIVLLVPWLISGWICIAKESRKCFNIFVGCSVLLLAGWSASFSHRLFRLEFATWPFFGTLGALAAFLTLVSVILAIIRRTTFNKGLADYLKFDMVGAAAGGDARAASSSGEDEKIDPLVLPATSLPTFSSAFPSGPAPPPRAMFPAAHVTAARPGRGILSWREGDDQLVAR